MKTNGKPVEDNRHFHQIGCNARISAEEKQKWQKKVLNVTVHEKAKTFKTLSLIKKRVEIGLKPESNVCHERNYVDTENKLW